MTRTLDTLLVALLAAECAPMKCPVERLQHAVSRVEILLRDEFGFTETAKELGRLREAANGQEAKPPAFPVVAEPGLILPTAVGPTEDVLTGRKKRRQPAMEVTRG